MTDGAAVYVVAVSVLGIFGAGGLLALAIADRPNVGNIIPRLRTFIEGPHPSPLPVPARRQRLTAISMADLDALVAKYQAESCVHCGGLHPGMACPRVKRLVFNNTHAVQEVEFWPWDAWPKDRIEFLHELMARPVKDEP